MVLQDALVMSAVPAHDVMRSRTLPSPMPAASPVPSEKTSSLVETFQALALNSENTQHNNQLVGENETGSTVHSKNDNENNDESDRPGVDDTFGDDIDNDDSVYYSDDTAEWESDEVRLSKVLHSWMSDYVITPLPRQVHTLRLPVFSAQLGRGGSTGIRRAESCESLDTQLSLFSCSSHGSRASREKKRRRPRRRKAICAEGAEGLLNARSSQRPASQGGSRWVELAKKRKGELDRFMMAQSHALSQGFNLLDESEAFRLCDEDEKRALYLCGKRNKMALAAGLKKSSSMTNIPGSQEDSRRKAAATRHRVASAGAKTFRGKPLDFQELKRQMINKRLSALSSWHRLRSSARGRSLHRSVSKASLTSAGSSDVFFATPPPSEGGGTGGGGAGDGGGNTTGALGRRGAAGRRASQLMLMKMREEKSVSMWKGDSQILAIDLKRELTSKVKHRIAITTRALERVTGVGDNNEPKSDYTFHLPEFPAYVDQDFALRPKIPQKIRISPHLSDVIKSDIRIRMGRPRYHEIRVQDLEVWNRGQTLDRAHRNLKVFNWLHSLREEEFVSVERLLQLQDHHQHQQQQKKSMSDVAPDLDDETFEEMVLIRAVDDPDIKPLFQHSKTYVR